jgi:hypothetical protein
MKKEVLNRIISEISSEKLTSSECREIANALKKQHNVIGGALYTTDDAECYVVTAVTNCMLKGKRAEEVHKKSMEKFVSGFDDVLQDFLIDGEEGCFCDFAMEIVEKETPEIQKKPSTKTYEF